MACRIGDRASFSKTVSESDVYLYAGITGDLNPAHVDEVWSKTTRFGGRIAHGMLTAGFISTVLGTKLPGPGTIYLSQTLRFTGPVRVGDTVTAEIEVIELIGSKARIRTSVKTQDGTVVIEGEAMVIPPKE